MSNTLERRNGDMAIELVWFTAEGNEVVQNITLPKTTVSNSIKPSIFTGGICENVCIFLNEVEEYGSLVGMDDREKLRLMKHLLREHARSWMEQQPQFVRTNWEQAQQAMRGKYGRILVSRGEGHGEAAIEQETQDSRHSIPLQNPYGAITKIKHQLRAVTEAHIIMAAMHNSRRHIWESLAKGEDATITYEVKVTVPRSCIPERRGRSENDENYEAS